LGNPLHNRTNSLQLVVAARDGGVD
jgi:hypothetical protein